jgi:hypothetical protein
MELFAVGTFVVDTPAVEVLTWRKARAGDTASYQHS